MSILHNTKSGYNIPLVHVHQTHPSSSKTTHCLFLVLLLPRGWWLSFIFLRMIEESRMREHAFRWKSRDQAQAGYQFEVSTHSLRLLLMRCKMCHPMTDTGQSFAPINPLQSINIVICKRRGGCSGFWDY